MTLEKTESVQVERATETPAVEWSFWAVVACFLLSGFAALLYQTAWLRQFAIVFGTSELAVATVLASYMAGLAAGAAAAARYAGRVRRPVLVYGLLELGVAVGAVAVPLGLSLVRQLHVAVLGGQPQPPGAGGAATALFYFFCALVLMLIPTGCMGATLPMLARHAVHRREQIGSRVGVLYAVNTAGAVGGALFTAFVVLPTLGLYGTIVVGVALNFCVFLIAVAISRRSGETERREAGRAAAAAGPPEQEAWSGWLPPATILPLMLVSGVVSFTYEVLWTRLLSHVLGSSIYAFATMVATFLLGIAVGSAVAAGWARRRQQSAFGFGVVQFGSALSAIAVYWMLDRLPDLSQRLSAQWQFFGGAVAAAIVMLPTTLFIGATFPLAVRVLALDERDAPKASGGVYAWNTVGAVLGSMLAGFVIVPWLEYAGTMRLTVASSLAMGLIGCCAMAGARRRTAAGLIACAVVVLVAFQPGRLERLMAQAVFGGPEPGWRYRVVYYDVGRSATVVVVEFQGRYFVYTNGLPEASIALRGSWPERDRLMAAVPALACPQAEDALVVGLGGGVAVSGLPPSIDRIDVVELEPAVVDANRAIAQDRHHDPLSDPRVRLIFNDARSALALTDKKYDVIISQPSHPWTAGASHLYTREFMQLAQQHLKPGGIFFQWINGRFVDEELFKSLVATLLSVFPHVELYEPHTGDYYLIASDKSIEMVLDERMPAENRPFYQQLGIATLQDTYAMLRMDEFGLRKLCVDAPWNTDNRNLLATRSSHAIGEPLLGATANQFFRAYEPLLDYRFIDAPDPQRRLNWVYVVRRLYAWQFSFRAEILAQAAPTEREKTLARSWLVTPREASSLLWHLLTVDRNDNEARFALLSYWKDAFLRDEAERRVKEEAALLRGVEAAVVKGWTLAAHGEWQQLEQLEPQLEQAGPLDLCYASALHLRALWRVRKAEQDPSQRRLIDEAMQLLDSGWWVDPSLMETAGLLRMQAGSLLDDPAIVIETARQLSSMAAATLGQMTPDERRYKRETLQQALELVEKYKDDPRVDPWRWDEVYEQLDQVLGELLFAKGAREQRPRIE